MAPIHVFLGICTLIVASSLNEYKAFLKNPSCFFEDKT